MYAAWIRYCYITFLRHTSNQRAVKSSLPMSRCFKHTHLYVLCKKNCTETCKPFLFCVDLGLPSLREHRQSSSCPAALHSLKRCGTGHKVTQFGYTQQQRSHVHQVHSLIQHQTGLSYLNSDVCNSNFTSLCTVFRCGFSLF